MATHSKATTLTAQNVTSHLAQVFAQYPIEVAHGEGVWLHARDGRKILDFYGGPAVAGNIFPFLFITIMCGAISGFHALVSSGTTPKMITNERYARPIGYGAMLVEGLVACVAMIALLAVQVSVNP